jgi:two-component system chemotaxis response regulator CheV
MGFAARHRIVTGSGHTQGFLVEGVDTILRLDWAQMRVPPAMLASSTLGGLVTAITELPDGRLVMMLDVERVLAETNKIDDDFLFSNIHSLGRKITVLFADDSCCSAVKARPRWARWTDGQWPHGSEESSAWPPPRNVAARDVVQLVLTDVRCLRWTATS